MNHTCTLNQFRKTSGGREGHSVTLVCKGCGKTLVLDWNHALYGAYRRWKSGEMIPVVKPIASDVFKRSRVKE